MSKQSKALRIEVGHGHADFRQYYVRERTNSLKEARRLMWQIREQNPASNGWYQSVRIAEGYGQDLVVHDYC